MLTAVTGRTQRSKRSLSNRKDRDLLAEVPKRAVLPHAARLLPGFGLAVEGCRLQLERLDRRVEQVDAMCAEDEELGRLAGALRPFSPPPGTASQRKSLNGWS